MQALLVRRFLLLLSAVSLGLSFGCGGEAETSELRGTFRLLRGGGPVDCASQEAVRKVEVSLFDESGVSRRPGYPKEVSCAEGRFSIPAVPIGRHLLELVVFGQVGTSEDERMYQVERVIDFPLENDLAFELEPEVAFFELSWSFAPSGHLAACDAEVARVDVFVASGTSQGAAFSGSFGCRETPQVLTKAFSPRMYTVRLDAKSDEGFTVYSVTQNRLLSRGENRFDAVLEPLGGQLRLDWQFSIAEASPVQSCDGSEVAVSAVQIVVVDTAGGDPIEESVDCGVLRPHALTASRFSRGRALVARLSAEGAHRFVGERAFTMPEGDHDLPLLTLHAVGDVELEFTTTASSACAPAGVDRYVAELRWPGGEVRHASEVGPEANVVPFVDVSYGVYDVRLMGFSGDEELCRVQSSRMVEGRDNVWTDFVL